MSDAASTPTAPVAGQAHFARRATGFVRDIKVRDAVIFNVLPAAPGIILAVGLFWVLSVFSGVNIYVAILITTLCSFLISGAFGLLSQIMPRSGGEYILVSRSLHPALAIGASLLIGASSMLSIGYWGVLTAQICVGPMLTMIGVSADSTRLQDWGASIATHPWDMIFGIVMTAIFIGIMVAGTRLLMRIQFWLFVVGMLGLISAALTLLFTSRDSFINSYNDYAQPFTHRPDTYHYFIAKAHEAGTTLGGGTNWHNTVIAAGAFIAFGVWTWYSAQFAGEVRQGNTRKNWYSMLGGLVITFGSLLIMIVLLYHTVGQEFLTAVNAVSGDPTVYTLPNSPWWIALVATIKTNVVFVTFLGLTFFCWGPLIFFIQIIQPVRALFAWAFDQVIPQKLAEVNERTHTPVVSLVLIGLLGIPFLYLAAYANSFFTVVALATIVGFPVMFMVGLGAVIYPYRHRATYEASSSNMSLLGVPAMVLLGVGAMLAACFGAWLWLEHASLGLPRGGESIAKQLFTTPGKGGLALVACLVIAGFIIYYAGLLWRRSQGIDISLNYLEIPPE
jgi:APA family basic amino acid/polyamine antiporter